MQENDHVGNGGVTLLKNGNYVVSSFALRSSSVGRRAAASASACTLSKRLPDRPPARGNRLEVVERDLEGDGAGAAVRSIDC